VLSFCTNPTFKAYKECLQGLVPFLSALVAIFAVLMTFLLAKWQRSIQEGQRRIQKAQLENARYDRRFSVYEGALKYMVRLMQMNGAVDGSDLGTYVPEIEKGEFLFGSDVHKFLTDLRDLGIDLYVKSGEATRLSAMGKETNAKDLEVGRLMEELSGAMMERRRQVFRPCLKLEN